MIESNVLHLTNIMIFIINNINGVVLRSSIGRRLKLLDGWPMRVFWVMDSHDFAPYTRVSQPTVTPLQNTNGHSYQYLRSIKNNNNNNT